jgi:hypothetical protein
MIYWPNRKGLQLEFTVVVEGAFAMPSPATMTYRRGMANGQSMFVPRTTTSASKPTPGSSHFRQYIR